MEYVVILVAIGMLPALIKLIDKGYQVFKTTSLADDAKKMFGDLNTDTTVKTK